MWGGRKARPYKGFPPYVILRGGACPTPFLPYAMTSSNNAAVFTMICESR
jgi:hypothetical protein